MKRSISKTLVAGVAMLGAAGFATEGKAQDIEPGVCGCMDVVFAIDDTGSMGSAITNVKSGLASIISDIETASAGDAQTAVVTFKDDVEVDSQLMNDGGAAASAAIAALVATGGLGDPEASDEALNTIINALPFRVDAATGRTAEGFDDLWRADCVRITILITDQLPGGFNDLYELGTDDVNAAQRAVDALNEGIFISAIQINAITPPDVRIAPIMMNYADVSGGFYAGLSSTGSDTSSAISDIIAECGDVAIQADIDIKFCSDPNAFNTKQKGKTPLTIFGSDSLDVELIDISTLMLCEDGDPGNCTMAPESWSFADRGDPSTDLGAASCALDDFGNELDTLNPDGDLDLDVAFDSQEVVDVVELAGGFDDKGDISATLVIKGLTTDGIEIYSAPLGDVGIDQLLKQNK